MSTCATVELPPLPVEDGVRFAHIEGHPGYCVSSDGRILSCKRVGRPHGMLDRTWRPLRLGTHDGGYPVVSLWARNRGITRFVHHLVAEVFLGPRPEGLLVLHRDGNPANNRAGNLYYGTAKQNVADARRHGTLVPLLGGGKIDAKLDATKLVELRTLRLLGASRKQVATFLGVSTSLIGHIEKGRAWRGVTGGPVVVTPLPRLPFQQVVPDDWGQDREPADWELCQASLDEK